MNTTTTAQMTITCPDWTAEGLLALWEATQPYFVAAAAAAQEQAWLIANTPQHMPGWAYNYLTGAFIGPADTDDAYGKVGSLVAASSAYANSELETIKAEAAQEDFASAERETASDRDAWYDLDR